MAADNLHWQASASNESLRARARLLSELRQFFAARNVLEVETPLLGANTVTDVHLVSFSTQHAESELYLQTSPEYAMKRLLAGGCESIFQICKAFRQEEQGKQHNPEFTLLEWYRIGFTLTELMDEVEELVTQLLNCTPIERFTYKELFERKLNINPHTVSSAELQALAREATSIATQTMSDTDALQLLMSQVVEPELPAQCFVYDYPANQAALAQLATNNAGEQIAKRFELYAGGMELANGYFELTDATEQQRRFEADAKQRTEMQLPAVTADKRLLAALQAGLPSCAGVALGVDRLLMLITGSKSIADVVSFSFDRA